MADGLSAHILVVDDEPGFRDLLTRILEPAGYEVRTATNAHEALRSIAETPPAVAICDIHMPGPTGIWLASQIREQSPTTAMVLATSDSSVPPTESMRRGIVAYILKPYGRQAVLAAVADAFRWWASESAGELPRLVPRVPPSDPATEGPARTSTSRAANRTAPARPAAPAGSARRGVSPRALVAAGIAAAVLAGGLYAWKSRQTTAMLTRVAASSGMVVVYDAAGRTIMQGSGFFVAPDVFVTNHHVVDGGVTARIIVGTGEYRGNALIGVDRQRDLALLKTSPSAPTHLSLATVSPGMGDAIAVYGAPLGLKGTLSTGIVSAAHDVETAPLQISAPISPGSSGSPVVNDEGAVIGVAASSNSLGQGLNFAIPVAHVRQLLEHATAPRPLIAAARGAWDDRERYELIGPVRRVTRYTGDTPAGKTLIVFDRAGRIIEVQSGHDTDVVQFHYDESGRLTTETRTGESAAEQWVFTPRGPRVLQGTESSSGHIKRIEYDEHGRLLSEEVRSNGQLLSSVRWTYDSFAWPSRADGTAPVKEERDALGNPTTRVFADGTEATYTYHLDARGNWIGREEIRQDPKLGRTVTTERRDIEYWD
jgi:YD repeat-containing protein